jgi:hypothetical protein
MEYTPVTNSEDVATAQDVMASRLKYGAEIFERAVGYRGGSSTLNVYWHKDAALWAVLEPAIAPGRYYNAFGLVNPRDHAMLSISCEINPPIGGINRRCAGFFVHDKDGRVFLAHSGKVGGGRAGIGKDSFNRFYTGGNRVTVNWPDGISSDCIIISDINSAGLTNDIAAFVAQVARFKESVSRR